MQSEETGRFVPFHSITLLPMERPTIEQLRVVRALALATGTNNYLELRALLKCGGFQCFGEVLAERAAELSRNLSDAGIPHRVDETGIWKVRRSNPDDPRSRVVFERPGVMMILPASEVPK